MNLGRKEWPLLVVGDLLVLAVSLYLTLLLRYFTLPSWDLYWLHVVPFSLLFLVSIFIFFIAGLYQKHTSFLKRELPSTILVAQAINVIFAAVFFFLVPYFGIAPKTNLVIYLVISSALVALWRLQVFPLFEKRTLNKAVLIASGKELEELASELRQNRRYRIDLVAVVDTQTVTNPNDIQNDVLKHVVGGGASIVIADTRGTYADMLVPLFYNLTFVQSQVQVLNFAELYEEVFDRVPLSQISHGWLLEHVGSGSQRLSSFAKRTIDFVIALPVLIAFLLLLPFVYAAMRIEGEGDVFIKQERIGRNGKPIHVYKLRTMTTNENGAWVGETKNKITRVGAFLRKTSIDELPQVVAVLKGSLSFIGPRSDVSGLATRLSEAIPFYNARYNVTPGISGWAQINQRYTPGQISPQSIEESRIRLAYDLYYVKHRSLLLDLSIALRTIKTLIVRLMPYGKRKR